MGEVREREVVSQRVGKGIRPALGDVYGRAELALRAELGHTSIADVLRETLLVS
ncbi:hypothetical protein ACFXJ8_18085 [Nonomuraea sp. NPDC059194]|uniref:hypothetical protein n=1 Tax=Nonomuraea sp. NPDC059194 TaxID=3346764 RepID=UPI0036BBFD29